MTLTPAYGRDYKSQKAVLEDFYRERDFLAHSPTEHGRPINVTQIRPGTMVQFRYAKLMKVLGHTVQERK